MTTNDDKLPLPLDGFLELDVTHIVAGPFCSMVPADMGAEVVKIERPAAGERGRSNEPFNEPFIEIPDSRKVSARYLRVNRNKMSVALDLRDTRCKGAFQNMVRVADVLLDDWGHGAMDRCPHLEARKMFVESGDTLGGRFRTVNTLINLTACVDTPTSTPPLLGEHNRDILCGIGGMTPEELARMEQDGVV